MHFPVPCWCFDGVPIIRVSRGVLMSQCFSCPTSDPCLDRHLNKLKYVFGSNYAVLRSFDIWWFSQRVHFLIGWSLRVSSECADWENLFIIFLFQEMSTCHLSRLNINWEMHWEESVDCDKRGGSSWGSVKTTKIPQKQEVVRKPSMLLYFEN